MTLTKIEYKGYEIEREFTKDGDEACFVIEKSPFRLGGRTYCGDITLAQKYIDHLVSRNE